MPGSFQRPAVSREGVDQTTLTYVLILLVALSRCAAEDPLLYRQFPDALASIVCAVRVGVTVTEALRTVAQDAALPTSTEFGRLYDQVGVGTPLEDALRDMAGRIRLPEYRFFATVLTETLENPAEAVRKRVVKLTRFGGAFLAFAGGLPDASHPRSLLA